MIFSDKTIQYKIENYLILLTHFENRIRERQALLIEYNNSSINSSAE
jgi:hypothetical protein